MYDSGRTDDDDHYHYDNYSDDNYNSDHYNHDNNNHNYSVKLP